MGRKLVGTITICLEEAIPSEAPERRKQEIPLLFGRQDQEAWTNPSQRGTERKRRWVSVAIILLAVAFSGYSWLSSLAGFYPDAGKQLIVRRAIVYPPDPPPVTVAAAGTLEGMSTGVRDSQQDKRQPGDVTTTQVSAVPSEELRTPKDEPLVAETPSLFQQGLAFQKEGRLEEAKEAYRTVLEGGVDLAALNNLGAILIREKNFLEARTVLEEAVSAGAGFPDPYYNLACLHALQTDVTKSLSYLKKAVSVDPVVRKWARTDQDLENLRGHVEYESIVATPAAS